MVPPREVERAASEYEGLFAGFYDVLHGGSRDVGRYLALAREHGGPVLEVGCGTGRVLVPLALAGHEVTGVDLAPEMLAICARKLAGGPAPVRAHLLVGDMRSFALRRRFPLALMVCNTFWHCMTRGDALAALARIREHLADGGRFALDVSLPDDRLLAACHGKTETAEYPDGERVLVCDFTPYWDPETRVERDRIVLREKVGGETTRTALAEVELRVYAPEEIRGLLAEAGLEILEEPLAPAIGEALFLCGRG